VGGIALNVTVQGAVAGVTSWRATISGPSGTQSRTGAPGATVEFTGLEPGQYTVTLQGYDGSQQVLAEGQTTVTVRAGETTPANVPVSAVTRRISLSVFPNSVNLQTGQSTQVTITIGRENFSGLVTLSHAGSPGGMGISFNPGSTTGNSSTVTIDVGAGVTAGSYTVTVLGNGNGVPTAFANVTVNVTAPVSSIELSLSMNELTLQTGDAANPVLTITRNNFGGIVNLSSSGAPNGMNVSFNPSSTTGSSSTVSVSVGIGVAVGGYQVTITGRGSGISDATVILTVNVTASSGSISLSLSASAISIQAGGQDVVTLTINRNNFSGTVNLTATGAPTGTTVDFNPPSTSGSASTVTITVGAGTALGPYNITLRGNGTGITEATTTLTLTVTAAAANVTVTAFDPNAAELGIDSGTFLITRTGSVASPLTVNITLQGLAVNGSDYEAVPLQFTFVVGNSVQPLSIRPVGDTLIEGNETVTLTLLSGTGYTVGTPSAATVTIADAPPPAPRRPTLAGGVSHTCGLAAGGAAWCWGWNQFGQLGNGTQANRNTPGAVNGGRTFVMIEAGYSHTCGLESDGDAWCWGNNSNGQLGDGTTQTRLAPVQVGGGVKFATIAAGTFHTCGLTSAGAAWCWGYNISGQLGDGSTSDRSTPQSVSGGHTFTVIAAADRNTCALTTAGAAYCWGLNTQGQLGDGTNFNRSVPGPVTGGRHFRSLEAGLQQHTCGLLGAGEAFCWGLNFNGQVGDGTNTNRNVPTAVMTGLRFGLLAAGGAFTCGIAETGTTWCWGLNDQSQLGNGSAVAQSLLPVQVGGGQIFTTLALGGSHACGRISTGSAYCWGFNLLGQLGDGTNSNQSTPRLVSGGLTFLATVGLRGARFAFALARTIASVVQGH
jgi:alpha-tubulin suppressor-like RCC1 family protein